MVRGDNASHFKQRPFLFLDYHYMTWNVNYFIYFYMGLKCCDIATTISSEVPRPSR
uniref:Uncharacterized protein n=1 Tax=Myoviridae sp. ctzwE5 TaxID=2825214 RepID=A0A8S5PVK4_9CAUD|nr:MAG TPA: hypothetical protein [Myoviridae sp. ctzwE5]